MEDQNFWNDVEASNRIMKEMKNLKDTIADFNAIQETFDDIEVMIEMAEEEDDVDLIEEAGESIEQFKKKFEAFRIETLLSGEFDTNNAVINIHSGAGGTESCDWVSMQPGDEAGLKSVTFQVNGYHAYGYLKSEHGIHRLVRISPFNANGKRQTSFCSVDVMPEVDDTIEIEIKDDDLKIDTYRSSGAGGQHINKTSSAVRITHLPTGIVVQCQNERSQHMNKDKAMKMLKTKLFMLKQQENMEKMSGIRGEVADNGFGSQIRSYVLQPYTLVKDHRTNCEVGDASRVLDGLSSVVCRASDYKTRRR